MPFFFKLVYASLKKKSLFLQCPKHPTGFHTAYCGLTFADSARYYVGIIEAPITWLKWGGRISVSELPLSTMENHLLQLWFSTPAAPSSDLRSFTT